MPDQQHADPQAAADHRTAENFFDAIKATGGAAAFLEKTAPALNLEPFMGGLAGASGGVAAAQAIDTSTSMLTGGRTVSEMIGQEDALPVVGGLLGGWLGEAVPGAGKILSGAGNLAKGATSMLSREAEQGGMMGDAAQLANRVTAGPVPHFANATNDPSARNVGDAAMAMMLPGMATVPLLAGDLLHRLVD